MKISIKALVLLIVIFAGCAKDEAEPTRPFYLSVTPFPYDISLDAVNYTYSKISTDADMITHHFDNGVPWVEALTNAPYSANIKNDWSFRKSKTPASHKVCVAVAPLSFERDGLARYRGESDDMPLPSPWDSYTFSDDDVKTAYLNYCKSIIDYFHPDFFNMAVEANLLYATQPTKWAGYMSFHQFVYAELKKAYPTLPIFTSIAGAPLLPNFSNYDYVQQRLAALQVLEHSDLYGISFYPYISDYKGNPYPAKTLDELFTISDKPLAIAETGFVAQSFMMSLGGNDINISSDPEKQKKYTVDLLAASQKYNALFVTQFLIRDYDQLWVSIGAKNDLTVAWRDTGLYDETGAPRPALDVWKEYLKREKVSL